MKCYYVSSSFATCSVDVDDNGIILKTSNIWRKFEKQPFSNLERWLRSKGKVRITDISESSTR